MPASTRERIIEASAALFMQRGLSASGLKQIAEASDATIGSLYHFFPGGKNELAAETLRASGAAYQALVEAVFDGAADVVTGTRDCFDAAAATLEATDYADACPVATVALEVASSDDELRAVSAGIFSRWLDACTDRLLRGGVAPDRARALAVTLVAALEGGFLLSRTLRSPQPLLAIGDMMTDAVADAVSRTASR